MSRILRKLEGGDLRSIGRSEEVVQDILENPALFKEVFNGMLHVDPIIRMRSADAIEKVSSKHPEYLQPFKSRLINVVSQVNQQEVRWHVAQMFSYLDVTTTEKDRIVDILLFYLETEKSKLVQVCSIQTLTNIAKKDEKYKSQVVQRLQEIIGTGSPALVSRAKKLLKELD